MQDQIQKDKMPEKENSKNADGRQENLEQALEEAMAYVKRMRESQEIANDILGVGSWYYEFDEAGKVINSVWSRRFREMLGYFDERDFPNKPSMWTARLHPEDRERLLREYRDNINTRDNYELEYRIMKKDGTYGWFRNTAKVLRYADRKPRLLLGSVMDVTSERERQHLQAILASVAGIYFASFAVRPADDYIMELSPLKNAPGIYPRENHSASFAMKYIVEKCISSDLDRKRLEEFLDLGSVSERLRTEATLVIEFKSTDNVWCSATIIPVSRDSEGSVTEYVLAFKEISSEKKAELQVKQALEDAYEAARRASSAKSDFLSNMSHDIRTPLNAIIGMTAIASTHIDDRARVQDCLGKITVSSRHLLGLINEVLDMSKIESGKMDLHMEEFDLSRLVDNLLTMTRPQIEARHHNLVINIHGLEHETVIGDSQRIQQAFMNLMGNAVKYTPPGGQIRLSITERPTNQKLTGCYEFVFEDNGIGMSGEFQKRLFEPFTRAGDPRVAREQGTGLGMAITRNIVRMMNGDITVESELNKGSRFTATIYLELPNEETDQSNESLLDLPVLVTDDDQISCECACAVLEELGMNGEWVLTGEEAVERVTARHDRKEDYFAVILDWKMPGMDGLATAKAIRAKVGKDVPIIIISAYDWSDIEQEARHFGVDAFISKPLFKSRMARTFNSLLHRETEPEGNLENELNEVTRQDFTGRRALLAEDNELNAEIAIEILKMTGLEVELARDGQEAFDMLSQAPDGYYDIVFMDIRMPVMNGYEVTRAVRSTGRDYLMRVPILAMTANAFAEDVEAAHSAGMNAHISKPVNMKQLSDALKQWLLPV